MIMGRAGTPPSVIESQSHTFIRLGYPIRADTPDMRGPGTQHST